MTRGFLGLGVLLCLWLGAAQANCVGRFVNPLTDVCWQCLFPMTLSGLEIGRGENNNAHSKNLLCACPRPPIPIPVPGIPVSFWEPVRLVEVTRTPYCLVTLGGTKVGSARSHGT